MVPLRDAIPPEADRTTRLIEDVKAMANDVGLSLDSRSIERLALIISRELPEAEEQAKQRAREMLRAISLGNASR